MNRTAEAAASSPQPSRSGRGSRSLGGFKWQWLAAVLLGFLALVVVLRWVWPVGYDFYYWYWPIPRAWLAGQTALYDDASRQFFSPPWTVWLLLPFSLPDLRWGMALLTAGSLAAFTWVSLVVAREAGSRHAAVVSALTALCPYTLTVLFVGTLDGLALLGLVAAQRAVAGRRPLLLGAAVLLAAVRPQHLVVTGPLLLLALRGWRPAEWGRVAVCPAAVLLLSVPFFRWDWPPRLWHSFTEYPSIQYLVTSTYSLAHLSPLPLFVIGLGMLVLVGYAAVAVWRWGLTPRNFDLALTVNAAASPYMLSQSYSVLIAAPWARLAVRYPWRAAAIYLISLPLLFRAGWLWDRIGLIDVTFPLLLAAALLLERRGADAEGVQGEAEEQDAGDVGHQHRVVAVPLPGDDHQREQQQR